MTALTVLHRQSGMTLPVAMVTLIVLMLLGLGAMLASNTMFKLAGNLQFENEAKNRAENALIKGEGWLATGTNFQNAGFTTSAAPYYDPSATLTPLTSWPSAAISSGTGESYIIQKITLNKVCPAGQNCLVMGGPPTTPPAQYFLYRVTARGQSFRGATRFVESIVQIPAP